MEFGNMTFDSSHIRPDYSVKSESHVEGAKEKPKTQQKQIKTSLQAKKLHNTEKIPGVSHETTKKTGKHVFWRLKITKKTQYNTKNPGWFHVKQEKTAKITTINSEFFCNDKQSGEPRSVFLACVPRETLFFSKILNIYAFCST